MYLTPTTSTSDQKISESAPSTLSTSTGSPARPKRMFMV